MIYVYMFACICFIMSTPYVFCHVAGYVKVTLKDDQELQSQRTVKCNESEDINQMGPVL